MHDGLQDPPQSYARLEGAAYWEMANRLQALGDDAVPVLLRGIEDEDPRCRVLAAKALLGLQHREAALGALRDLIVRPGPVSPRNHS